MLTDSTNPDVESTDQHAPSELDPLLANDVKALSKQETRSARAQFLSLCWALFVMGWDDGSTGPLLPRIQRYYDVGFKTVSWIFVLGSFGILMGALINMHLNKKLGLGKMLVVGPLFHIAAFTVQFLALPFPFFALSYSLGGIGTVFQDASANGFIATLQKDSEYKMGCIHAAYGCGALAAPLSATYFSQSTTNWSYHYLISLSLAVSNMLIFAGVFRFQSQETCLRRAGEIHPDKPAIQVGEIHEENNEFTQIIKNKTVHLLALFLMIYIGVEVTIGDWIVTFLLIIRGGGPSSGYVSTGFFGGLTLGRVVLVEVTKKIGAVNSIYVYILLAISFQLIVWLVPSVITTAISVSIIGLLLGPVYPTVISHTARVLPPHLLNGAIGWMSACSSSGTTLLPFLTGTMAAQYGIQTLQPLVLTMMIILVTIWFFVPKKL